MNNFVFIIIAESEWRGLLENQKAILEEMKKLNVKNESLAISPGFITAKEFMATIRIGRTKFDQLVQANKIRTIKKDRKIYVPVGEVERYFQTSP
jgi:hypothetical protein